MVVLADGANVGSLDGLLCRGIGLAVAVDVVLLLYGVAGDGVEALLYSSVDALDDFGIGFCGGLGLLGGGECHGEREGAASDNATPNAAWLETEATDHPGWTLADNHSAGAVAGVASGEAFSISISFMASAHFLGDFAAKADGCGAL